MFVYDVDNTVREEAGISSLRSLEEINTHPTAPDWSDWMHSHTRDSACALKSPLKITRSTNRSSHQCDKTTPT